MPKRRTLTQDAGEELYLPGAWNETTKSFSGVTICPGDKDAEGLTEEWIRFYKELDLEMQTANDREEAHKDPIYEMKKSAYAEDPDHTDNPENELPANTPSLEEAFSDDSADESGDIISIVQGVVSTLPATQQQTFEDLFRDQLTQAAVAERDGVKKQAVFNRNSKLCNAVKRKLADLSITEESFDQFGFFCPKDSGG